MCIAPGEARRSDREIVSTADAVEFPTCESPQHQFNSHGVWIQPHSRLAHYNTRFLRVSPGAMHIDGPPGITPAARLSAEKDPGARPCT
jgi:hypothetical protein